MTLDNAKVLHKHFLKIGRIVAAEQLERRFPELKEKPKVEKPKDKTVVDPYVKPKVADGV